MLSISGSRLWTLNPRLLALVALSGLVWQADGIAAAAEIVGYRLAKTTTIHLDDANQAKSFEASLRKLGVQTRLENHNGHSDLTMSCPQWREAEFPDHATAHKWQDWLKSLGFETKHSH